MRFVTSNAGKFQEVARMLEARGLPVAHLDVRYPEVQADSLEEVVRASLRWLTPRFGDDLLVDDSGLFIPALQGFPGVYSNYVFRTLGCAGVLRLLQSGDSREATFVACFGLASGEEARLFIGTCAGTLTREPRGAGGFGFDPIFLPQGEGRTFAEMSVEEKNALSHRARAADQLVAALQEEG